MARSPESRRRAGGLSHATQPGSSRVEETLPRISLDAPGRPRKKASQERSRDLVEAILEAAAQLLVEKGYKGTTTTAVADRAGVSIGSFYQYFASREELFQELTRRHGRTVHPHLVEAAQRLQSGEEPPLGVLTDLLHALVAEHAGRPALMAALDRELPKAGPPETAQWQADLTAACARFLAGQLPGEPEGRMAKAWVATTLIASVARALGHHPPGDLDPGLALDAAARALAAVLDGRP